VTGVVLVLLALGSNALADTRTIRDRARDPYPSSGDPVRADMDIRGATAGHAGNRVAHAVRVRGAGPFTRQYAYLELRARGRVFLVQWNRLIQSAEIREQIRRYPYQRVVGRAESRLVGTIVTFLFAPRAIGNPLTYRWRAITNAAIGAEGAPNDLAPNRGFVLHDIRPVATIIGGPPPKTNSATASFSFTSDQEGSTFQCKLDNRGTFEDCTSPKAYERLAPGRHTFAVRAVSDGRIGKPAVRTWLIVRSRPRVLEVPVRRGKAYLSLPCPQGAACQGVITIQSGTRILARGRYSIPPGENRDVALSLTAIGRQAIARANRISAAATVVSSPTGARATLSVVLIRR
jgi:hypothetical protein